MTQMITSYDRKSKKKIDRHVLSFSSYFKAGSTLGGVGGGEGVGTFDSTYPVFCYTAAQTPKAACRAHISRAHVRRGLPHILWTSP